MDTELIIDIPINSRGASVTDNVYAVIRKNILQWRLKPGQRISEKEISGYLHVSRTPVRESFIRLSSESLLDILPQRGTFVSKINLNEVEEGLFIRRSLETEVLKQAVKELTDESVVNLRNILLKQEETMLKEKDPAVFLLYDEEFHKSIFLACRKEMTWNVMHNANTQYDRVRFLTLIDIDKFVSILEEHANILEAIASRSTDQVLTAVNEHLGRLYIEEKVLKKKYPDYFL